MVQNAHTDMKCHLLASLQSRISKTGQLLLWSPLHSAFPVAACALIAPYDSNTQDHACCRYYGVNDPVARKMLNRVDAMPKLAPPEDAGITTLYVGGLTPVITEDDIRDQFYSYGELQSVKKVISSFPHLIGCRFLSREVCKYKTFCRVMSMHNHAHGSFAV